MEGQAWARQLGSVCGRGEDSRHHRSRPGVAAVAQRGAPCGRGGQQLRIPSKSGTLTDTTFGEEFQLTWDGVRRCNEILT